MWNQNIFVLKISAKTIEKTMEFQGLKGGNKN